MASNNFCLGRDIVKSKAFRSLARTALVVYFDFRLKCKVQKTETKKGREDTWVIINNGEIEYTYSEAESKGIPRSTFMRAIDELVEKGFIDIEHSGSGGQKGDKSQYAISERWRDWGTDKFIEKRRPKDTRKGRGFARMWKDRQIHQKPLAKKRNRTIIGNEIDTSTIIENDTSVAIQGVME